MDNKFDELAKSMAQSVTRRTAFKKFGVGLAAMALAAFGLANKAEAANYKCLPDGSICNRFFGRDSCVTSCCSGYYHCSLTTGCRCGRLLG